MTPYGLNLKSFNNLKKDQTNIKIFKYSSFDSNFNSVQSLNTNLSQLLHQPSLISKGDLLSVKAKKSVSPNPFIFLDTKNKNKNIINPKFSTIIRAIRSIRLNRDEWKLIRYINLMEKKIISSPFFSSFNPASISSPNYPALEIEPSHISLISPVSCVATSIFYNKKSVKKKINNLQKKDRGNNKIFSYNNIISKNILLRNTSSNGATTRYNFLKSTLSSILKKKIRKISEILEDKSIKNYVLFSYLNNCIFTPPHFNGVSHLVGQAKQDNCLSFFNKKEGRGRTKLSLNKNKGSKFGSFINYNKIIGYKFNSIFYPDSIPNLKDSI